VKKDTGQISPRMRSDVFRRDGSRCTETDPRTGERCASRYMLEPDHIIPVAIGGRTELSNLRSVCWHHNQRHAVRWFGAGKMEREVAGQRWKLNRNLNSAQDRGASLPWPEGPAL
jgi:5-methylcytosine-specific restriction endonuclease McrA